MCSVVQGDVPGNFVDKDMFYEHIGQMGAGKYLRESCYHRIKCSTTNFLAALMWRRPLNSVVLATPMYRGSKRVSDRTNTQIEAWMDYKWKAKIV